MRAKNLKSRVAALDLAKLLHSNHLFVHVVDDNKPIMDANLFYRFTFEVIRSLSLSHHR